ncbi:uncharacterized protein PG998_003086 [Apiospora kogelbergensis]|uniref:uncharacterized protein n=1 Tax=Apiospora kogelbergensis TaxID=1337665 RepID=UPI00312E86CA
MHSGVTIFLVFAAILGANGIPDGGVDGSRSPPHDIDSKFKRDGYDCEGSGLCKTLSVAWCDKAVNYNLKRDDVINYGAPGCRINQYTSLKLI